MTETFKRIRKHNDDDDSNDEENDNDQDIQECQKSEEETQDFGQMLIRKNRITDVQVVTLNLSIESQTYLQSIGQLSQWLRVLNRYY